MKQPQQPVTGRADQQWRRVLKLMVSYNLGDAMTDGQQIALAIAPTVLPTLTVLVGILMNNRQIDSLTENFNRRVDSLHREFELTRSLFTEQLRRVEEVVDARLKHLEER